MANRNSPTQRSIDTIRKDVIKCLEDETGLNFDDARMEDRLYANLHAERSAIGRAGILEGLYKLSRTYGLEERTVANAINEAVLADREIPESEKKTTNFRRDRPSDSFDYTIGHIVNGFYNTLRAQ